jgi:hypothetical protein
MARYEFGGVMAAWVVTTAQNEDIYGGATAVVLPTEEIVLDIRDAPDGSPVTDFLDENGDPVSSISVQAGDPYIPYFQGPDDVDRLYVQADTGRWLPIPHYTVVATGGGGGDLEGAVLLEGGNEYEYEDSAPDGDPWLRVRVPNDNTNSSTWPNRLEFQYWDDTTGQYRTGFHLNEKCLLRVRGVTPGDVAVRFIAHPNLSDTWPVMEVTGDNSQDPNQKYFQVFQHSIRAQVGMQVPYLTNPKGERLYWGSYDPNEDEAWAAHRPRIGDGWLDFTDADEGA